MRASRTEGSCGPLQDVVEDCGEGLDAWEVCAGQALQLLAAAIGELEVHATLVERVALATDQPGALRTLSELDRTVVAYVQRLRGLPDRRPGCGQVSTYDKQQLMQRRGKTGVVSALLAPTQELA